MLRFRDESFADDDSKRNDEILAALRFRSHLTAREPHFLQAFRRQNSDSFRSSRRRSWSGDH